LLTFIAFTQSTATAQIGFKHTTTLRQFPVQS